MSEPKISLRKKTCFRGVIAVVAVAAVAAAVVLADSCLWPP